MVKLKGCLKGALQASSLLEVVVAMVAVSVLITISFLCFFNLVTSKGSFESLKVRLLLEKVLNDTKRNKDYLDEDLVLNGILIRKRITNYKEIDNLLLLKVEGEVKGDSTSLYLEELVYE
ncbi:hypothetical protein [Adhaeribacter soli]|uniref:Uncharacterized protein n=1 Tax=Adhaeribacter soli TaxID=2607655 RepID=A0A5N1IJR7_9BACT|nr:hypothetical protein [Adhaeribacter soli]KAA9324904.1 hypothetical protein F0P94_19455 [Adhaeribacter soli]